MVVHHFPSRPLWPWSRRTPNSVAARPCYDHTSAVLQLVTGHATTNDQICYKGSDGELWQRRQCCDFVAVGIGKATTIDKICCNQWGPSHGGGDHGPAVVTTTRWCCCNQFVFCYNHPHFLLLLSSDFAGNDRFFRYHRLDSIGTNVSFCFHCIVFLLEPASYVFYSTVCVFFCWNRVLVLLEPTQVFATTVFLAVRDAAVPFLCCHR